MPCAILLQSIITKENGMDNVERFKYVMWALDNFPDFVKSPEQYRASLVAWESRKTRVFDPEYLMACMRSKDLVFPTE
jgi:hypothetical protein